MAPILLAAPCARRVDELERAPIVEAAQSVVETFFRFDFRLVRHLTLTCERGAHRRTRDPHATARSLVEMPSPSASRIYVLILNMVAGAVPAGAGSCGTKGRRCLATESTADRSFRIDAARATIGSLPRARSRS